MYLRITGTFETLVCASHFTEEETEVQTRSETSPATEAVDSRARPGVSYPSPLHTLLSCFTEQDPQGHGRPCPGRALLLHSTKHTKQRRQIS